MAQLGYSVPTRIVEANSVEDFIARYYKSERRTKTLVSSYLMEYKRYGFVCTSHYDNVTGADIYWPRLPKETLKCTTDSNAQSQYPRKI